MVQDLFSRLINITYICIYMDKRFKVEITNQSDGIVTLDFYYDAFFGYEQADSVTIPTHELLIVLNKWLDLLENYTTKKNQDDNSTRSN